MKIIPVYFSEFKAPGQKMFGNTPEYLWNKYYPAEKNGICTWALRSLLITNDDFTLLIDSGFGNSNKEILNEYSVTDFKSPHEIIKNTGIGYNDVNIVLHTHLHLDHCGGSFLNEQEPSFPNATYIVSEKQLLTATNPSEFEKESFQPEIIHAFSGFPKLKLIEKESLLFSWLELKIFNGHTNGLIVPLIHSKNIILAFVGDLIPSVTHLLLDSIMGYNTDAGLSIREQKYFLTEAIENNYYLFFQHDCYNECCNLKYENNRIVPDKFFRINVLDI
jgi:glyoxylase-like metal-dependent hydrolase (beta-lactamase superfamily II)